MLDGACWPERPPLVAASWRCAAVCCRPMRLTQQPLEKHVHTESKLLPLQDLFSSFFPPSITELLFPASMADSHFTSILATIRSGEFSDLKFVCNDKAFFVHKSIVCTQSSVLNSTIKVRLAVSLFRSRSTTWRLRYLRIMTCAGTSV